MRRFGVACLAGIASGLFFLAQLTIAVELTTAFHAINASDIKVHIEILADDSFEGREAGTRGGQAAGDYLIRQLEDYGLKPAGVQGSYYQPFRGNCRNILAILEGSDADQRHELVVIGAHYDHVGYGTRKTSFGPLGVIHNGADDNASGVAGVLEVIEGFFGAGPAAAAFDPVRVLGRGRTGPVGLEALDGRTDRAAGPSGLENQRRYDRVPTRKPSIRLRDSNRPRTEATGQPGEHAHRSHAGLQLGTEGQQRSSLVFCSRSPVLMLHTGLHDFYHRPIDDAHRINHEGNQQVARLLFTIAHEVANKNSVPGFRPFSRSERPEHLADLERPLAPRPPRLGVTLGYNDAEPPEVLLRHVYPGLPADRAGLQRGDVLLSFADHQVLDIESLLIHVLQAQSPATVRVRREVEGQSELVDLAVPLDGIPLRLGLSWREDVGEPGTLVLSEVVPNSAAQRTGLQVADRIYEIGGYAFATGDEFRQLVKSWTGPMPLLIERQGRLQTVTIELPSPQL
jgi:hypothetical protein